MRAYRVIVLLAIAAAGLAACGGGAGGGSSDVPSITTISSLPSATSPMASSASGSVSAMALKGQGVGKAATTGLPIVSTTESAFSDRTSMGACNTFNQVKDGVTSAAQADMVLCIVKQMDAAAKFAGLTDNYGRAIDIYDGNYHIFNMNMEGAGEDEGPPDRIKMRIVKDASGNISTFEMFMCRLVPGGGGALEQNEYTRQIISGTDYAMRAQGTYRDAEGLGSHYVDVAGKLNGSGAFLSKSITVKNTGNWGGSSNWGEGTLIQTPGAFAYSGYHKGGFYDPMSAGYGSYEDVAYAQGQMIGDTGPLSSLAMGDGAVKYGQSGKPPDSDVEYAQSGDDAWNGDTAAPVQTNDYMADVLAGTLPTAADSVTIAFGDGESWNCDDDVAVGIVELPVVSFPEMVGACSAYMFNHQWIQCYEKIGMCNMDNMCHGDSEEQLAPCHACFPDGLKGEGTRECLIALCDGNTPCLDGVNNACPAP